MKHSLKQECFMANCLVTEDNAFGPSGYMNLNCPLSTCCISCSKTVSQW